MTNNNFFIAIEGLDGVGKSTICFQLFHFLESIDFSCNPKIQLTYEPHILYSAGYFIRQVLRKEIEGVTNISLALAFASNRLDHSDRFIRKCLEIPETIVISDRYFLSSLVYQEDEISGFSFDDVWNLNKYAKYPDLILFLDAKPETCLKRMKLRNTKKELFEGNTIIRDTREKYEKAIQYLQNEHGIDIVKINAENSIQQVVYDLYETIKQYGPDWLSPLQEPLIDVYEPYVFTMNGNAPQSINDYIQNYFSLIDNIFPLTLSSLQETLNGVEIKVKNDLKNLSYNNLGALVLGVIKANGFQIEDKITSTDIDGYYINFEIPFQIRQNGLLLLFNENTRDDIILEKILSNNILPDFIIIFRNNFPSHNVIHYIRDGITTKNLKQPEMIINKFIDHSMTKESSPAIQFLYLSDILKSILILIKNEIQIEYYETLLAFPEMRKFLNDWIQQF